MISTAIGYSRVQREISMRKDSLVKIWHASVSLYLLACFFSFCVYVYVTDVKWTECAFALRGFKYLAFLLSVWVAASQVIYFNIFPAIDIIDAYSKRNPKLLALKDHLHNAASYLLFMVVFPLSLLVTILFWTFYFWKREEMYPRLMDEVFPPFLNHVMHTFPTILSVLYMFTSNQKEPPKTRTLTGLVAVISIYVACVFTIKLKDGEWVYLVIDSLTPLQIQCTFAFVIIGSISFLFLGYHINDKIRVLKKKLMEC